MTRVERTAGEPFATIEATPLAQLDKSREVLLVWRNTPEPIKSISEKEKTAADTTKAGETVESTPSADNKTSVTEPTEQTKEKPEKQNSGDSE